jgi:hypothetical protein
MVGDFEMKREKIGSFWVDTATVMMGDPCQILQNDDCNKPVPTYKDLMEKFFPANPHATERVVNS